MKGMLGQMEGDAKSWELKVSYTSGMSTCNRQSIIKPCGSSMYAQKVASLIGAMCGYAARQDQISVAGTDQVADRQRVGVKGDRSDS